MSLMTRVFALDSGKVVKRGKCVGDGLAVAVHQPQATLRADVADAGHRRLA